MSEMQTATPARADDRTASLGEAVQHRAEEAKNEGGKELRRQLDERTNQVGRQAKSLAQALRKSGAELETREDMAGASKIASGAADRIEQVGGYLESVRGDVMLRDAERVARDRPWLVAGTAALIGLAASRLLKASSERRYDATTRSVAGGAVR
jgi:ElaB/YqjD/DUF883 family membrane-anchored ribosome-binding protein